MDINIVKDICNYIAYIPVHITGIKYNSSREVIDVVIMFLEEMIQLTGTTSIKTSVDMELIDFYKSIIGLLKQKAKVIIPEPSQN